MPKPPQAARSLRRYRGRARSRFAALCPQSQPTALPHTVTIPGVVAQPPTGQTSKSTRRLTGSRGPLNTGRDPYGDAVSVRLQIGTLSGFVSERRPASNRNGVRLQVGIGVRLRRYPHSMYCTNRVYSPGDVKPWISSHTNIIDAPLMAVAAEYRSDFRRPRDRHEARQHPRKFGCQMEKCG